MAVPGTQYNWKKVQITKSMMQIVKEMSEAKCSIAEMVVAILQKDHLELLNNIIKNRNEVKFFNSKSELIIAKRMGRAYLKTYILKELKAGTEERVPNCIKYLTEKYTDIEGTTIDVENATGPREIKVVLDTVTNPNRIEIPEELKEPPECSY